MPSRLGAFARRFARSPSGTAFFVLAGGVGLLAILGVTGLLQGRTELRIAPEVVLNLSSGSVVPIGTDQRQIVVVNFFASWCPPCRDEAPALRTTWARLEDDPDVVMAGIIFKDSPSAAAGYMRDFGLGYPTVADDGGTLSRAFRISGIPKTFVIAPDGTVVLSHFGAIRAEQLLAAVEEARARSR